MAVSQDGTPHVQPGWETPETALQSYELADYSAEEALDQDLEQQLSQLQNESLTSKKYKKLSQSDTSEALPATHSEWVPKLREREVKYARNALLFILGAFLFGASIGLFSQGVKAIVSHRRGH